MNREEQTANRRKKLLESYLILHDFRVVPSEEATILRLRTPDNKDYHLRIDPQWLRLKTDATVKSRLDKLGLIPFLQENGSAWIGVTATGGEVITHIEG